MSINLGHPLQAIKNLATSSATLMITVGAAESFHLQRLAVSVASITDGAYVVFSWATATAGTAFHTVSASVTNVGFLDFGERGYAGVVGESFWIYTTGNCSVQATAIGYKIG